MIKDNWLDDRGMSFQIPCMRTELDKTLDHLLSDYFTKGFTYLEIQEFLRVYRQQTIGLSTIKRHLKKLNLFRRPVERIWADDATLLTAVREELSGSGSNLDTGESGLIYEKRA